jgi:ribose 1,5-bisphosphokinase PhnN
MAASRRFESRSAISIDFEREHKKSTQQRFVKTIDSSGEERKAIRQESERFSASKRDER